jgi:hypothetical protein
VPHPRHVPDPGAFAMTMTGGVDGASLKIGVKSFTEEALLAAITKIELGNIDSFRVRSEIHRSHPRAWLHDKRDGEGSLIDRVDRMLDPTVEDLRIIDGSLVLHIPSMAEHHHREAVRLVMHHPEMVTFHSDTATKAVRRFGAWLNRNGSSAAVVSHGNRKYRLASRS